MSRKMTVVRLREFVGRAKAHPPKSWDAVDKKLVEGYEAFARGDIPDLIAAYRAADEEIETVYRLLREAPATLPGYTKFVRQMTAMLEKRRG